MPSAEEHDGVRFPLYVLGHWDLSVIASVVELEREFEGWALDEVYDAYFRRVKLDQNRPLRGNSFKVSLDTSYSALEARLWLRSECIRICLVLEGSVVDDESEQLFTMDMPELLQEVALLQERAAELVAATYKPPHKWFSWLFRG